MMTSDELRNAFLNFFESKGHQIISSSSLIPYGDPTLLLTSAGMVQFKPYFLGEAVPPNPRLASCQKCFRTTDIESVGDPSHLTFFEMLGNFSIGDYFKKEAISWAWEFVRERLGLPEDRLWITIYLDDEEAFRHWRKLGVPENRILRLGEKTNFWGPAGDSGPCGPCSEIHYDFGAEYSCKKPDCGPGCDCRRYSEIWNLVFTQYNQDKDGHRTPLPKPNIDTGMGLERTAAILQGKTTVYETDLFTPLLNLISGLTGKKYGADETTDHAMRVAVEHSRGIAFLIADGVLPGNEGRGYVLRRLLRRAQYFGEILAPNKPFIGEVAKEVVANMGHVYPEIRQRQGFILEVIDSEIEKFREALRVGRGILNQTLFKMREELAKHFPKFENAFNEALSKRDFLDLRDGVTNSVDHFLRDCPAWEHILGVGGREAVKETLKPVEDDLEALKQVISNYKIAKQPYPLRALKISLGEKFEDLKASVQAVKTKLSGLEAFILHDRYGFPVELTKEIAAGRGFSVDLDGFEKEMEKQRKRARATKKFGLAEKENGQKKPELPATKFTGYTDFGLKNFILEILVDGESVETIKEGEEAGVVLESTPFYGEMGGQVGDTGEIRASVGRFLVTNTARAKPDIIVHQGKVVEGTLTVGEKVTAEVDKERRLDIARNHTATHLLQAALRQVLGEHIQQKGSLVTPDRLRFDFSHLIGMTKEEIEKVNQSVNDKIRQDLKVYDEEVPYKQAIAEGVIALFEEKYGETVRAVKVGSPPVSAELCGGTHLSSTGEIGFFHIVSESSIGSGLRRIEAVTGRGAEKYIKERFSDLEMIAQLLETKPEEAVDKAGSLVTELKDARKQILALERELSKGIAESLANQVEEINGVKLIVAQVPSFRIEALREMSDLLREKLKSVIIVLGTVYEDKPIFLATVTPDLVAKGYNAGEIIKKVARVTGGGGGGKPAMAQAGGKDKTKLDEALRLVKTLI